VLGSGEGFSRSSPVKADSGGDMAGLPLVERPVALWLF